ncbi:hypothetical protein ACV33P_30325, partial [Pseudomonas aeruginosa]
RRTWASDVLELVEPGGRLAAALPELIEPGACIGNLRVPPGVEWLRTRVERVDPEARRLLLEGGDSLEYRNLIVCPGLRLAWERIEGLEETLGRNGVTSNYRYDLAPYTWELVRGLRGGKAL